MMSPGQRDLMRSVFDGPIVDHYGQTERVAMAGVCEVGTYHVFPDYGILELIDVEGRADRKEIVGTALHNWGSPVLRYRTGDEVGPTPAEPCPCGRAFPRLGALDGRAEDSFMAADGRVVPLPSAVVDDLDGLLEAQIVQLGQGRFEIRIVPGAGFDAEACRARAMRNVDRLFGPGQHVTIRTVDRIPRSSSGKVKAAIVAGDNAAADGERPSMVARMGRTGL
jgi:phenylacetate-CoA ligase